MDPSAGSKTINHLLSRIWNVALPDYLSPVLEKLGEDVQKSLPSIIQKVKLEDVRLHNYPPTVSDVSFFPVPPAKNKMFIVFNLIMGAKSEKLSLEDGCFSFWPSIFIGYKRYLLNILPFVKVNHISTVVLMHLETSQKPPFVKDVNISILGDIDIDFDVYLTSWLNIMRIAIIGTIIKYIVCLKIKSLIYYPRSYLLELERFLFGNLKLSDSIAGIIRVKIKSIIVKKLSTLHSTSFVNLKISEKPGDYIEDSIDHNGLYSVWNRTFDLIVYKSDLDKSLELVLNYSKSGVLGTKKISGLSFSLDDIVLKNKKIDGIFCMTNKNKDTKAVDQEADKLDLDIAFYSMLVPRPSNFEENLLVISINVTKGRNITLNDSSRTASPYVEIDVEDFVLSTIPKILDSDPVWKLSGIIPIRDWRNSAMTISVKDSHHQNKVIGSNVLKIKDLVETLKGSKAEISRSIQINSGIGKGELLVLIDFGVIDVIEDASSLGAMQGEVSLKNFSIAGGIADDAGLSLVLSDNEKTISTLEMSFDGAKVLEETLRGKITNKLQSKLIVSVSFKDSIKKFGTLFPLEKLTSKETYVSLILKYECTSDPCNYSEGNPCEHSISETERVTPQSKPGSNFQKDLPKQTIVESKSERNEIISSKFTLKFSAVFTGT